MATAKKQKRKRLVISIEEKVEVVAMLDKGLNYICMNMYTMYDKSDTCSQLVISLIRTFSLIQTNLCYSKNKGVRIIEALLYCVNKLKYG